MARRNVGVAPDEHLDIRIGFDLGDVIVEGPDRHGESVNIVARLEQLAEPGGICVSQTVIDHLGNKLSVAIEAMGEHQVKNTTKPVKAYRGRFDGARAVPAIAAPTARQLRARHALQSTVTAQAPRGSPSLRSTSCPNAVT
jgi:class 3 adenylate cyclase